MGDVSIRVADMRDRDRIFELLREAAVWLRDRGVDYWQNWHAPPPLHVAWIEDGITAGQFRMVERDGQAIACFRLQDSDELFWGARDEPSVYVHSLTVDRALAGRGIGSLVLARIGEQAAAGGAHLMRLDCGTSADGLRRYYESQGFGQVGETIVDGESLVLYEKSLEHVRCLNDGTSPMPQLGVPCTLTFGEARGCALRCREMAAGEEQAVLDLVMRGFDEAVRPDFSEAGVAEFSRAARSFVLDPPPGHRIFVAESDDGLLGMIDIRDSSHVALFFVESAHRHRGIGSALLVFGADRCDAADSLTVKAAPSAVPAYLRLGFEVAAPEAEENGIRFVHMRKRLSARAEQPYQADDAPRVK